MTRRLLGRFLSRMHRERVSRDVREITLREAAAMILRECPDVKKVRVTDGPVDWVEFNDPARTGGREVHTTLDQVRGIIGHTE